MFAGTDGVVSRLLPGIIDGYAGVFDAKTMFTDEFVRLLDAENQPLAHISIDAAPPSESFEWLADGVVDVIFTDVSPTRNQREMMEGAGGGNLQSLERERIIGVSGLVALTHSDNIVSAVSQAQIAAVLGGATVNWADLGGPDAPITVYALPSTGQINGVVARHLLEPNNMSLQSTATILASQTEIEAAVANDLNGIAVVLYDTASTARLLPIENSCGMVIAPSVFTMKSEEYPLADRLFAYSHLLQGEYGREFIDYLDSPALDGLVAQSGFVDLSVIAQDQSRQIAQIEAAMLENGDSYEVSLMTDLIAQMSEYDRGSTTLRFRGSSDALDNRGARDLARIRDYVVTNDIDTIALVGYTDNQGDFDANLRIAEDRAQIVADALRAADRSGALDGVEITVQGYGGLNPVACNDSAESRAINRRVEVWFD